MFYPGQIIYGFNTLSNRLLDTFGQPNKIFNSKDTFFIYFNF